MSEVGMVLPAGLVPVAGEQAKALLSPATEGFDQLLATLVGQDATASLESPFPVSVGQPGVATPGNLPPQGGNALPPDSLLFYMDGSVQLAEPETLLPEEALDSTAVLESLSLPGLAAAGDQIDLETTLRLGSDNSQLVESQLRAARLMNENVRLNAVAAAGSEVQQLPGVVNEAFRMLDPVQGDELTQLGAGSESPVTTGPRLDSRVLDVLSAGGQSSIQGSGLTPSQHQAVEVNQTLVTTIPRQPLASPQWAQAVGDRVLWLNNSSKSSAKIILNPPELGLLELKVDVAQDKAHVWFGSESQQVRDALEHALPRLRAMLESQGMTLGDVEISSQGGRSQNPTPRPAVDSGSLESTSPSQGIASTEGRMTIGLVDLYA